MGKVCVNHIHMYNPKLYSEQEMVIATPPLAESAICSEGVMIKPPLEVGVANLLSATAS